MSVLGLGGLADALIYQLLTDFKASIGCFPRTSGGGERRLRLHFDSRLGSGRDCLPSLRVRACLVNRCCGHVGIPIGERAAIFQTNSRLTNAYPTG